MKTTVLNLFKKVFFMFFGLLLITCSSKKKKDDTIEQVTEPVIEKIHKKNFEEVQDSLRKVLLNSKPNENLKSSLLQELYIRGLVMQKNDEILFNLPFNLHRLGCNAPDCYSTNIIFKIPLNKPIEFPFKIDFKLLERGCIDKEETKKSVFILKEKSQKYVNYFSEELKSNLIIKKNGELYYYPHLKLNSISIKEFDEMFVNGEFDNAEITPYQSTVMITNEYSHIMKK